MADKTLDEHAEAVHENWQLTCPEPDVIYDAYKAERAVRMAVQDEVKRLRAYAADLLAGVPTAVMRVEGDGAEALVRAISAEARVRKLEAERDEARRAFLMCAEAAGVVYEAEGRNTQPGPPDAVASSILANARRADELEVRVRELEAEKDVLRRRIETTPPWGDAPLSKEEMDALRKRWSFAPEQYQADADALIATVHMRDAQLARLRDAIIQFQSVVVIDDTPRGVAAAMGLKSVLEAPGQALADVEEIACARVNARFARLCEVLAELAAAEPHDRDHHRGGCESGCLRCRAEAAIAGTWLRRHADDLETGHG